MHSFGGAAAKHKHIIHFSYSNALKGLFTCKDAYIGSSEFR